MFVEQLHQFGESGKGSREAVDLSNHEHVDLFGGHLIQQSLKGRAVQRGSREAVVQEWAGIGFQMPARSVLKFVDASPGCMMLSDHAARSMI